MEEQVKDWSAACAAASFFRASAALPVALLCCAEKRFSVKVTPMQPLLAVVAEALAQLKLGDVDPKTCQLLLNKKALDLGCPVRLANLPSGAKLELITGEPAGCGYVACAGLGRGAMTSCSAGGLTLSPRENGTHRPAHR